MINKIKQKILHILRKNCGYYELANRIQKLVLEADNKNIECDNLFSKYEAKILEYDILKAEFDYLVENKQNDYYKFLVQELESILKIMKQKGTHPQDILIKTIREAKKKLNMEK